MVAGGATLSTCWGRWDRLAGASDAAPRRFSRSPSRRAKDSSPVRQHWENDGPASAPGPGGTTGQPVPLFHPVPGLATAACLLPAAMRRGLLSVALRALRTIPFAACRHVGQVGSLMPLVFSFEERNRIPHIRFRSVWSGLCAWETWHRVPRFPVD